MRREILRLAEQDKPPPKFLTGSLARIPSRAYTEWRLRHPNDRKTIRRTAIAERDGWTCGLCGEQVELRDLHIDHILPVSLGGRSNKENLQAAHSWCNISKGNRIGLA